MRGLPLALAALALALALLVGPARAAEQLPPDFRGSLCTCQIRSVSVSGIAHTTVDVLCISSAGFANFLPECSCPDGITTAKVACPAGTKAEKIETLDGTFIRDFRVTNSSTDSCDGPRDSSGCTDGSKRRVTTNVVTFSTESDNTQQHTLFHTVEVTPCTKPGGGCTCVLDDPPFSPCSTACGPGEQTRTRTILRQPKAPDVCPPLQETRPCDLKPCPQHCVVSEFGPFSACNVSCGDGIQVRTRQVVRPDAFGGEPCPELVETQTCTGTACPVNCTLSEWSPFSDCTKPCGEGGVQTRTRTVITAPQHGGSECGALSETRPCNVHPCPVHCVVGPFGNFSECSKTCGAGTKTRTRNVITPDSGGGQPCPSLFETVACDLEPCPVDCVTTDWSAYGSCSALCGNGTRVRTRLILVHDANSGKPCGPLTESEPCTGDKCPVDCKLNFSDWSECSSLCGGGFRIRTATVVQSPSNGGAECLPLTESEPCNLQECVVHCEMSEFTAFSPCSATCGPGTQERHRTILRNASGGGRPCGSLIDTQPCEVAPCPPVDCVVEPAGNFSQCPVDCVVEPAGNFSQCSSVCGPGLSFQELRIVREPSAGGKPCPPLLHTVECNAGPCPVDCQVTEWGEWGPCSKSCGGGVMHRNRSVVHREENGGHPCPPLVDTVACGTNQCTGGTCTVSAWSEWGACSKPCGGGSRSRTRSVVNDGGHREHCPPLEEHEACNSQACQGGDGQCSYGEWYGWSSCHVDCAKANGEGSQYRRRPLLAGSPAACTETREERPCQLETPLRDPNSPRRWVWAVVQGAKARTGPICAVHDCSHCDRQNF